MKMWPRLIDAVASAREMLRAGSFWRNHQRARSTPFSDLRRATNSRIRGRKNAFLKRPIGLEVERLPHNVGVVFVEDNPEAQIDIEARPPFPGRGNLGHKSTGLRFFHRYREEEQHVAFDPRDANTDCDQPVFSAFGLSCPASRTQRYG